MKNLSKISIFLPVLVILFLFGCNDPLMEGGSGTVTINMNGGARAVFPPTEAMQKEMEFKISLQGPTGTQNHTLAKGVSTANYTLAAGTWTITMEAFYQGSLYATGSNSVNVIAGQNNPVTISMREVEIAVTIGGFTFYDSWAAFPWASYELSELKQPTGSTVVPRSSLDADLTKALEYFATAYASDYPGGFQGGIILLEGSNTSAAYDMRDSLENAAYDFGYDDFLFKITGDTIYCFLPMPLDDFGYDKYLAIFVFKASYEKSPYVLECTWGNGPGESWLDVMNVIWSSGPGKYLIKAIEAISDSFGYYFSASVSGASVALDSDYTLVIQGAPGASRELTGTGFMFYIDNGMELIIEDLEMKGNGSNGDPLIYVHIGSLTLSGTSSVVGNTSGWGAGGVAVDGGMFTMMDNSSVRDNTNNSSNGGGVIVYGGTFTMKDNSSMRGNSAYGNGGGVYINGGHFLMTGGQIADNEADMGSGGGVYVGQSGTFTKTGGTIYGSNGGLDSNKAIDGEAAYAASNTTMGLSRPTRSRALTAGPGVNLNSETAVNWD